MQSSTSREERKMKIEEKISDYLIHAQAQSIPLTSHRSAQLKDFDRMNQQLKDHSNSSKK